MAEIAAGVVAAEQVVSTTVQAGAAGYAVGKPSNGLSATFSQLATASPDGTSNSLARSNHSLTVVGDRAYIFGGQTDAGKLATNHVHSFALPTKDKAQADYHLTPAIALAEGGPVPQSRRSHSACALGGRIAVFGGVDESGSTIVDPAIWLYDPQKSAWEATLPEPSTTAPAARSTASLFSDSEDLLLYGGKDGHGTPLVDVWIFVFSTRTWARLPDAPASTTSAAFAGGSLYLISATDALSSALHHLSITIEAEEPPSWDTVQFPTNPLTPGPRPRENGGLLHVTTGFGRQYLLYLLGDRQPTSPSESAEAASPPQWSDMWSLQLPASHVSVERTTTFSEAIKPAKIKDAIRSKLGYDAGTFTWAEVDVKPPGDLAEPEGKVHPGPRSSFGCDVLANRKDVALWGGINAKGEQEGDGWIIQLE
ncbi:hypothetical protein JX265_011903 [Neoarthrinium moseri]|uniref:Galactose oxidase n=1 Tax=Neoarthrinium moseri TaxID=1658444 RepID=A0A9Q0AK32_9PEZI|nr:hypothetical protein JX266_007623 [Neoarthrinium moseri]KAI1856006.1 hypothetical protein JX265_011903 [Neoarthrinium moseri]